MVAWILSIALALSPLPGIDYMPPGSEIRVVSTNYLTVYAVWRVDERRLVAQPNSLPTPDNTDVRILFTVGGKTYPPYNGTSGPRGDIRLKVGNDDVSMVELLTRTYRLNLPGGKLLPEGK